MSTKYHGVIPAFYACYDKEGAVSPQGVRALAQHLLDKGVQGVYVGGSSGECIYQSVAERKLVLEEVMAVAKGKMTVIAHVACNNTADSQELARHAESLEVDAIASIPPIYFKLPEAAIAQYWNDISAAAPNTDFIIYNIPQLAGVSLTVDLCREMAKNPRVIGVKNSSMAAQDIQLFQSVGGFMVFNGPDEQFISGRAMGAVGGIGGTYGVMPDLFLKLDGLIKEGKLDKGVHLQHDICEIIYAMCGCTGNLYAVMKEILRRRNGLELGGVREPLPNLVDSDHKQIDKAISLLDRAYGTYL